MANDIAKRAPEAFPDPYQLDIHREARHHVAFGFGERSPAASRPRVECERRGSPPASRFSSCCPTFHH
jgi:hypothetical protein